MEDQTRLLPIWHGGEVVAHALVDAEDFLRLNRYRWCMHYHTVKGRKHQQPYRRCKEAGKYINLSLTRAISGEPAGGHVRHRFRNGNPLDYRRANLDFKGGSINLDDTLKRAKYRVHIFIDGHNFYIGGWPRRESAEGAREAAARVAPNLRGRGLSKEQIQSVLDLASGRDAARLLTSIASRLPQYLTPDEREDASQSIVLDILSGELTPDGLTLEVLRGYARRAVGMARNNFKFISLSQQTDDGREFGDHLAA